MQAVVGEVIAGRYELQEVIGTGGMASVYRARDQLLERTVALKVLHDRYSSDEDFVERFRREARAAAQLTHPGVVTVIDRGEHEGRQFIVFEHVEGETLKDVIERSGPMPVERALELALQIARALDYAHANDLVHRDVKPQNILLNGDGRAKVTDFGIVREMNLEHGMTQTGTVLGTGHYLAPEQAQGEDVDAQSDVYSLGAVLYELLTGEVPFPGDHFVSVAMRHVREPAPSVLERSPDVPPRVAAVVAKALEKDPARRFPTMRDFARELETCLTELRIPGAADATLIVPAPSAPPRPRPARARRPRWPLALALVLLAAGGAIVAAVLLQGSSGSSGGGGGLVPGHPVHLTAAATFDPEGDGTERDELIPLATDGDASTAWETEHYNTAEFGNLKSGVGIIFFAARDVKLSSLTVTSDTPGFTALVKAGDSQTGPFAPVSSTQTVEERTTFSLDVPAEARYYLLWITHLPPGAQADVNEVTARS